MIKPTPQQLREAVGLFTPDILAPDLRVVFCGINPSVYSAVVGHHFARPGNRFWPALHRSGWTPRLFAPDEDRQLLDFGLGITNMAAPASVAAADLTDAQLRAGASLLSAKIERFAPQWLAILGVSAYRIAFQKPKATFGPQDETIGGAKVWVLPNPSGLNAHYTPVKLAEVFREFRLATGAQEPQRTHRETQRG